MKATLIITISFVILSSFQAKADNVLHPGNPVFDRPTITALGIQLPVSGDDNYNATVAVQYRKAGDSLWRQGLPLFRVHPETTLPYVIAPQFAGSILDLRPATQYEIQLHVTDPDGPVDQIFSLSGSTRAVPGDPVTPRAVGVFDANSLNNALGNAQPGNIITLANGTYAGSSFMISNSGTSTNPIVIRGASEDGVIVDGGNCDGCNIFELYGSYIHLENLTAQNAQRAIKFASPGTQGIVVRHVHVRNTTLGMTSRENQLDFYIADNILEGRLNWPQIYTDDNGLHSSDDGINVSGFGHVVAHNQISGYGKAVINEQNGSRAIDFYGNDVRASYDAALKFAFLEGNGRIMRNRLTNVFMGVSLQPVAGGPAYVYRNVASNVVSEQLKMHSHANPTTEPNGVFAYNNTFVGDAAALIMETAPNHAYHFAIENNLFVGPLVPQAGTQYAGTTVDWYSYIVDGVFDYNGYWPDGQFNFQLPSQYLQRPSFAALQQSGMGIEPHGVLLNAQTFASGMIGLPDYRNAIPPSDFTLSPVSAALDGGLAIPNISDVYNGLAPDLGALEAGCPAPIYGPRPAGMDENNESFGCAGSVSVPAQVAAVAGTPQSATVQTAFGPLQAKVLDTTSKPMANVAVTFTAPASGATGSFGGATAATATTDGSGVATAPAITANNTPGSFTVTATVAGVGGPATFVLTNKAQVPASVTAIAGTAQSVTVQTQFAALQAKVVDAASAPVPGIGVTFSAPQTGASGTFNGTAITATVTTDGSGIATAPPFTANNSTGSYTVTAAVNGVAGRAAFVLTNTPGPASSCFAAASADHWTGEYFNNMTLGGAPAMTRDDGANRLSLDWGLGSPSAACGLGMDGFSARWTRTVNFAAGTYRFTTSSDDGMRLYVDGVKVQDRWYDQSANYQTADVSLTSGPHAIRVEYYEHTGYASASVDWSMTTPAAGNPTVTGINPATPLATPGDQSIAVSGSLFQPGLTVDLFNSGVKVASLSGSQIQSVTANSFKLLANFGGTAGAYGIEVVNPANQRSARFSFNVQAPGSASCNLAVAPGNWTGEYFNNMTVSGNPVMVRDDGALGLSFRWGLGSPGAACGVGVDAFSARWTRTVNFAAGTYRFTTSSDDGMRLYVDGVKVQDRWYDQGSNFQTVDVPLTSGPHTIWVEYYEHTGDASASVDWVITVP